MDERKKIDFEDLPSHLLECIFYYIPLPEIVRLSQVSPIFLKTGNNVVRRRFFELHSRIYKEMKPLREELNILPKSEEFTQERIAIFRSYYFLEMMLSELNLIRAVWRKIVYSKDSSTAPIGKLLHEFYSAFFITKRRALPPWHINDETECKIIKYAKLFFECKLKDVQLDLFGCQILDVLDSMINRQFTINVKYHPENNQCSIDAVYKLRNPHNYPEVKFRESRVNDISGIKYIIKSVGEDLKRQDQLGYHYSCILIITHTYMQKDYSSDSQNLQEPIEAALYLERWDQQNTILGWNKARRDRKIVKCKFLVVKDPPEIKLLNYKFLFVFLNKDFRQYANETAKLFVEVYQQSYMPSSLHNVLIHGSDMVKTFLLTIKLISENTQGGTKVASIQKISGKTTNEELMNRLLVSSHSLMSVIACKKTKLLKLIVKYLNRPPKLNDNVGNITSAEDRKAILSYFVNLVRINNRVTLREEQYHRESEASRSSEMNLIALEDVFISVDRNTSWLNKDVRDYDPISSNPRREQRKVDNIHEFEETYRSTEFSHSTNIEKKFICNIQITCPLNEAPLNIMDCWSRLKSDLLAQLYNTPQLIFLEDSLDKISGVSNDHETVDTSGEHARLHCTVEVCVTSSNNNFEICRLVITDL